MSAKDQIKSLEKSFLLLTGLAENGAPSGLSELARSTGLATTTAYRLLQAMKSLGLVEQETNSKKYRLGPKLISLGVTALGNLNLRKIALPEMTRLREETGETVNMAILDGTEILFVERIQSDHLFNVNLTVGSRLPIYCTSQGKALMAFMAREQVNNLLTGLELKPLTPRTLIDPQALRAELAQTRQRGYAINNEELEPGLQAIAAPVRDHSGAPVAAVGVSYAVARHPGSETIGIFAGRLCRCALNISRSLGFIEEM